MAYPDVTQIATEDLMLKAAETLAAAHWRTASNVLRLERVAQAHRAGKRMQDIPLVTLDEATTSTSPKPVPRTEVVYGIGIPDGKGGIGMTHGPVPDYRELLKEDVVEGSVLIRFEGTSGRGRSRETILYRYLQKAGGWYREDER